MKFLATLLLACCFQLSFSQDSTKQIPFKRYSTIGIGGGSSHYWGDLSPIKTFHYGLITLPRWNLTANYTKYYSHRFALRVGFSYIRIMGDDFTYSQHNLDKFAGQFLRNLHFRNDIKEFTATAIYNFSKKNSQKENPFVPYAFAGFGFYGHNPLAKVPISNTITGDLKLNFKPYWIALAPLKNSGNPITYSDIQLVVPVGFGIKKSITSRFEINAEMGFRITPFDYLDDAGEDRYFLDYPPYISEQFSNRSRENYTARTGKSRIEDFKKVILDFGVLNTGATPYNTKIIGEGFSRGTGGWDYYATFQITANYKFAKKEKK
jgi:hypothetical protein